MRKISNKAVDLDGKNEIMRLTKLSFTP